LPNIFRAASFSLSIFSCCDSSQGDMYLCCAMDAEYLLTIKIWHLMLGRNSFMAHQKTATIAVITITVIGLFLALSTIGALGAPRGSGRVRAVNVGVYLDSDCTISCTSINWGNINPGSTVTKTIYIKNLGSTTLSLQLSTINWKPRKAMSLITLSWNLDNYQLSAGKTVPATLTLTAASNMGSLRDFSFVVVITGIQQRS